MNDLAGVRNRLALRSLLVRVAIFVFLEIIAQYPGILYTAMPLILWFLFLVACLLDGRFASKALRELERNPHLAAHPHHTLSESSGTATSSSATRPTMHSSTTMAPAAGHSPPPQQHVFATQPPTGYGGSDANGFVILRHQRR
ncbi:hypothetical protein EXIGLDRAFT_518694 [Exidia glandulosa HHB12029]|uniref:Uncharacterized protein n=1 Tax=Exidia glandulosa HHB12029 TaxID=1314781 RepID=A0A165J6S3_EXIGL|nr:hypothetical protein EXIGLDRAFT_518694 [Exidia glandulosa HHB12029]